jgi:hypothetical protein
MGIIKNSKVCRTLSLLLVLLLICPVFIMPQNAEALTFSSGGNNAVSGQKSLNIIGATLAAISDNVSVGGASVIDSTSVPVKPLIRIEADKNIAEDCVWENNKACITLTDSKGNSIPITVTKTYVDKTKTYAERNYMFIEPESNLAENEKYTIHISAKLTANNGKTLGESIGDKEYAIAFTTAASDSSVPVQLIDISNHWGKEHIEVLVKSGIINGYTDNTFRPDNSITRAEFAKILVNAFGLTSTKRVTFSDVKDSDWYSESVSALVENEIALGMGNGYFGANNNITRQDMAVMLYKVMQKKNINIEKIREFPTFNDAEEISEYARNAVKATYTCAVFNGMGDGYFQPNGQAARGQVAAVVDRILTKTK